MCVDLWAVLISFLKPLPMPTIISHRPSQSSWRTLLLEQFIYCCERCWLAGTGSRRTKRVRRGHKSAKFAVVTSACIPLRKCQRRALHSLRSRRRRFIGGKCFRAKFVPGASVLWRQAKRRWPPAIHREAVSDSSSRWPAKRHHRKVFPTTTASLRDAAFFCGYAPVVFAALDHRLFSRSPLG